MGDGNEIDASVWLEMPDPLRFWDRSSAAPGSLASLEPRNLDPLAALGLRAPGNGRRATGNGVTVPYALHARPRPVESYPRVHRGFALDAERDAVGNGPCPGYLHDRRGRQTPSPEPAWKADCASRADAQLSQSVCWGADHALMHADGPTGERDAIQRWEHQTMSIVRRAQHGAEAAFLPDVVGCSIVFRGTSRGPRYSLS
ncbi:hypothetical protein VTN02DRAFT_1709 [Thermoascus thermophilus]